LISAVKTYVRKDPSSIGFPIMQYLPLLYFYTRKLHLSWRAVEFQRLQVISR